MKETVDGDRKSLRISEPGYMSTSWTLGITHKMYNHFSVDLRKDSTRRLAFSKDNQGKSLHPAYWQTHSLEISLLLRMSSMKKINSRHMRKVPKIQDKGNGAHI